VHLNEIAFHIWQWCEERQLYVYASYIKSKDNVEADEESRRSNIDTEWDLSPAAFDRIISNFGYPQVDLFATRINAKCKKYVSWKRDPEAFDIDAFTLDWSSFFFYAFPPFSLILKSLRKIINEEATGIIVVPYWPSQPWFPIFMKLSKYEPIYFNPEPELLLSPFRTRHPLWKRLTLVSTLLSGKLFQNNSFQAIP
ncbi:jg22568, partial [Pararge aegeria aegeria]